MRSLALRVLRSIRYNAKEARDMGFSYAARRLVSRSSSTARVPIKGVGPLTLRFRSSDEPTIRQIFIDG